MNHQIIKLNRDIAGLKQKYKNLEAVLASYKKEQAEINAKPVLQRDIYRSAEFMGLVIKVKLMISDTQSKIGELREEKRRCRRLLGIYPTKIHS